MEEYELFEKFQEILEVSKKRYANKSNYAKEDLLKKYKGIIEAKAKKYSWKTNKDKEYWVDEGYFILLGAFYANPFITSEEVRKLLNIWLRDTERKIFIYPRENEKPYGLDPGLAWSAWETDWETCQTESRETKAQEAHYELAREKADKEEKELELFDILGRLEDRERVILYLYFFESRKLKEIADFCKISIPMVFKIKKRVLEKLKKELEGRGLIRGVLLPGKGKKLSQDKWGKSQKTRQTPR